MFSIVCRLDIEDSDSENELIPTDNENPAGKKKSKRLAKYLKFAYQKIQNIT